jgi:hypothetical protein
MNDNDLRRLVRACLIEAMAGQPGAPQLQQQPAPMDPQYVADLDAVLTSLQACLKGLEAAHQKAPDPVAKTVITGVHSDLFNAAAEARGFIKKLKAGRPAG